VHQETASAYAKNLGKPRFLRAAAAEQQRTRWLFSAVTWLISPLLVGTRPQPAHYEETIPGD